MLYFNIGKKRMENQAKVNIWSDFYSKKVTLNDVTNFDEFNSGILKISNSDLYNVFNLLLDGKTIQISEGKNHVYFN